MKLGDHVEHIRQLLDKAFRNRLGRMGITVRWAADNLPDAIFSQTLTDCKLPVTDTPVEDLKRIIDILNTFYKETGKIEDAYEKLIEEFTFTLFNRIAAMKVMEAHTLHPEIITRRSQHGDRSFAHFLWLEQNPEGRNEENEALLRFLDDQLTILADDIPLFSPLHPYHLLPTAIELNGIINAYNQVEIDAQVETEIWKSDDVLGWLYESYNNYKKTAHKESGDKTEYNKVSIQSQVYTPRWVVKFLVDNSLGKLYLEMFPDSAIKEKYKIANAPKTQTRERKPLTEIRMIDMATGSGNFVLYGFDLFYDLYLDQVENYGADYNENKLPELIIQNNLYGIDLDDRAVQLAQLGLYIKAKRKKRTAKISHFNIVSSDFFLPEYKQVKELFENGAPLSRELEMIVIDLWSDLQQAYKFGSLIRLEEKFTFRLRLLEKEFEKPQLNLLAEPTVAYYKDFRKTFFSSLREAVSQNAAIQGMTMLKTKTQDALTFLQLLTQKYDVAVANPPYTDSSDFGAELKSFIDANYRQQYKFNSNLYAAFIKRCYEVTNTSGKIALIHPLTFMYIKSFEDVRKFIIDKLYINVFVDYGLSNLFGAVMVDPAFYVLEKEKTSELAWFISLDQYTRTPQEKFKKDYCLESLKDQINNKPNKHNYLIDQSKLKIIEGFPFIYWISDGFREKFVGNPIIDIGYPTLGLKTANNNKYLRFWWEVLCIFTLNQRWIPYAKGGEYNKWFGNIWLLIFWANNGQAIKNQKNSQMIEKGWEFKEGVTLSTRSVKGASARFLDNDTLFDMAASSIISKETDDTTLILCFANSFLFNYILDSLNPTVNIQPEDIRRVPFVLPEKKTQHVLKTLALKNMEIKMQLNSYKLIEPNFKASPILCFNQQSLRDKLLNYFNADNEQVVLLLINEAIINKIVFDVYSLSQEDRQQVEAKMGIPVGEMELVYEAKMSYLLDLKSDNENVLAYIKELSTTNYSEGQVQLFKSEFNSLYQSNNCLEEFCIRNQVNPINAWYWFKESNILPQSRATEIALEFLADACRTILMEDEDGIIPLIGLPNEPRLLDRLEQHCLKNGLTSAQFMQLDGLLGRPVNEYIEHHFFKNFSDHLNLFMYLPKTPFIWHLSSGEQQGFEAFIIIYKWNRDSLFKLKTQYLGKRVENLEYRLIELRESDSAQAQTEKEKIRLQLQEIIVFTKKIEELIAGGYDPKLDDGVGKNIAPLQKKGLLRCDVLNKKQLEKYLNADW